MHAPGPWRAVRVESGEYYTHQIEAAGGHIASIAGWSAYGTICPISEANARLVAHAPDLALRLSQLLAWNEYVGSWDARCWDQAHHTLEQAVGLPPIPPTSPATRTLLNQAATGQAWNEHTELSLLIDFLDAEIGSDPRLAARLKTYLMEAAS